MRQFASLRQFNEYPKSMFIAKKKKNIKKLKILTAAKNCCILHRLLIGIMNNYPIIMDNSANTAIYIQIHNGTPGI